MTERELNKQVVWILERIEMLSERDLSLAKSIQALAILNKQLSDRITELENELKWENVN